jgi:predicted GNAT family N-acyltransferase
MSATTVQLVLRKGDPFLREAELKIKQWWSQLPCCAANIVIERQARLDSAVERARQTVHADPTATAVIVPLGFEDSELDACDDLDEEARIEVMCFRRGFDPPPHPSASLLEHGRIVIGRYPELPLVLDKLRLRLHFKEQQIQFRPIVDRELEQYFRLRYEVYKPLGYIPSELDAPRTGWELHWSDRWSAPFGAFTAEGKLIGCARLVSEQGGDNEFSTVIERLVDTKRHEQEYAILRKCSQPPMQFEHPFDLLAPFERFGDYYRTLVRNRVAKAEVSRVMRLPQARGQRLGEVIVDSVITAAARHPFQVLFLACRKEHGEFYEKCGFQPIRGMECDRFGTFPIPAIAMWRWLGKRPRNLEMP